MERLSIEGIQEFWQHPDDAHDRSLMTYRPAMLVECSVNFRSLRAGLNHSEERNYSAWLPESDLAINWDTPAAEFHELSQLASQPDPTISYRSGNYLTKGADLEQCVADLTEKLVRAERLSIYFNPVFG